MKKFSSLLLFVAIFFSSAVLQAQGLFPLQELVKLTSKNASDFETVMLEKDYSLQSKLSDNVNNVYTSDKGGVANQKYSMVRRHVPNASVGLTFTTSDKKYYLELKAQLNSSGYKFVKEESAKVEDVQTSWFHYTNGIHTVSICTYTTPAARWFAVQAHLK